MHTVWWVAKVMACSICASSNSGHTSGRPAVNAMRTAINAAASTSQPLSDSKGSQFDLGSMKKKVTKQICDKVLAQGKSML